VVGCAAGGEVGCSTAAVVGVVAAPPVQALSSMDSARIKLEMINHLVFMEISSKSIPFIV
jgi:hypothetical protein